MQKYACAQTNCLWMSLRTSISYIYHILLHRYRWNTRLIFSSVENLISSHVKDNISFTCEDIIVGIVTYLSTNQISSFWTFAFFMNSSFWTFAYLSSIDINITNRTLHGHLEIPILSSRVQFWYLTREISIEHWKIKLVYLRAHVISSIFMILFIWQKVSKVVISSF